MEPVKHYSVLAIAGPHEEAMLAKSEMLDAKMYNKVYAFGHADDYGNYPDTTGYEDGNWEDIELVDEDSNLYKYMTKCMDAVLEYVNKKYTYCCGVYGGNVEKHIHWPRKGGKMFFVTGHVIVEAGKVVTLH